MTINQRTIPVTLLALFLAATGTGCVGPACGTVSHAPMQIIGHVQDANQEPVPNKSIRIAVAPFMDEHEAIKHTVDYSADPTPTTQHYPGFESQTDANGDFTFAVPARSAFHSVAVVGFIVIGRGTAKDECIVVSSDAPDSQIYLARLHKRHLTFYRINKTTYAMEPVSNVGSIPEITGSAKRSENANTVTLRLTVP